MVCSIAWWSLTKFVQMKVPGSKMALRQWIQFPTIELHKKKYSKIFFFRTVWLRYMKFGMWHCQVVVQTKGPRNQDGPVPGGPGFEP